MDPSRWSSQADRKNDKAVVQPDANSDRFQRHNEGDSLSKGQSEKYFDCSIADILWATHLIVVPLLALSAVFLALIFSYKIDISEGNSADSLSSSITILNSSHSLHSAYFVDIGSTRLITIASLTSTVVTFLPSWVMLLMSYPLAARYLNASQNNVTTVLPTPYQLRIIIELLMGSYGSLWNWLTYRCTRSKLGRGNSLMSATALLLLISFALGFLIILADTWLHLTTATVVITQSVLVEPNSRSNFSRLLSPSCDHSKHLCTVRHPSISGWQIYGVHKAYKTLFNLSPKDKVLTTTFDGRKYALLGEADLPHDVAFEASTFAISTQCEPISRACNLKEVLYCGIHCHPGLVTSNNKLTYKCSSALQGDLTEEPAHRAYYYLSPSDSGFFFTYFYDANINWYANLRDSSSRYQSASGWNKSATNFFTHNTPTYFVAGAKVYGDARLAADPEGVTFLPTGETAFLLGCTTKIVDMTYRYTNGIASAIDITPSNKSVITALTSPWLVTGNQGLSSLERGLQQSALSGSVQDVADAFGLAYSRAMLSLGVNAVKPGPTLQQSNISARQVTRLPTGPLYILVVLNCLYAILGVMLAVAAFAVDPRKVKPVQTRMSITGLTVALFEDETAFGSVRSLDDLFVENDATVGASNSHKVAVTNIGGWAFRSLYHQKISKR